MAIRQSEQRRHCLSALRCEPLPKCAEEHGENNNRHGVCSESSQHQTATTSIAAVSIKCEWHPIWEKAVVAGDTPYEVDSIGYHEHETCRGQSDAVPVKRGLRTTPKHSPYCRTHHPKRGVTGNGNRKEDISSSGHALTSGLRPSQADCRGEAAGIRIAMPRAQTLIPSKQCHSLQGCSRRFERSRIPAKFVCSLCSFGRYHGCKIAASARHTKPHLCSVRQA